MTFDPLTGQANGARIVRIDLGQGGGTLYAVSCVSVSMCTAVSSLGQEVAFNPVSGLSVGPGVKDIDGSAFLTSVACPSASLCAAVDEVGGEVAFRPTTGSVNRLGVRRLAGGGGLSSVACPSAVRCVAVSATGRAVTFDPAGRVPDPHGVRIDSAGLTSVACGSPLACVAVDEVGREVTVALTARVISRDRIREVDPAYADQRLDSISSLSCPSSTECTALDGREITFDPRSRRVIAAGVKTLADDPNMSAVSCPSTTECTAVDGYGEATFDPVSGWVNRAGFRRLDDNYHALLAVSCASTSQCTAVDTYGSAVTFDPASGSVTAAGLTAIIPATSVDGIHFDVTPLIAVACPSTGQCTAIDSSGAEVTFNPISGEVNPTGVRAVGRTNYDVNPGELNPFTSVLSCPSSTQCTAVDTTGRAVTFDPVSGNINTRGSRMIDAGRSLSSVACPSIGRCVGVDTAGRVMLFDPQSTATQGNMKLQARGLTAVACGPGSECVAANTTGDAYASRLRFRN